MELTAKKAPNIRFFAAGALRTGGLAHPRPIQHLYEVVFLDVLITAMVDNLFEFRVDHHQIAPMLGQHADDPCKG